MSDANTPTASTSTPTSSQTVISEDQRVSPTVPTTLTATSAPSADPFDLVSSESMFAYLEALTAIQPYSGWRNSASEGEAEALSYVEDVLQELAYLQDLGLDIERQVFRVFMGTELWETRLHLNVDDQMIEVPADGLRGPRDDIAQALQFDSDGTLNDVERNPVIIEGPVLLVRSLDEIRALSKADVQDKLVFLDYETIDRIVQGGTQEAVDIAEDLIEEGPSGLVLVTRFTDELGRSHGSFVGDNSALNWVASNALPPTLYVRLEDLAAAGLAEWDDLAQVRSARLTWDADVFSPAQSGNLVARIAGADSSRAVILGAHIDSPNSPGAMDDGSGSVILLEIARVLNASRTQPPIDLYLVWFGSEEIGLCGSAHFAATHQELLDQTQAMLQTDMLSYPLDGIEAAITLVTWSYGRLGDGRLPWPEYLAAAAASRGIQTHFENLYYVYSDNSSFGGFDVPHADMIYVNESEMEATGSIHYATHIHDPYDTVELAREMAHVLEQMAQIALAAALEPTPSSADLRVTPRSDRRAVFVASHTESVHMTPTAFTELGMVLSMAGFDVDLLPYGQPVTLAELDDVDVVVVLPVVDYPSPDGDPDLYDETWDEAEITALQTYVAEGGLLVLTNSANRLKYGNTVLDPNEDWSDANDLAGQFGIAFRHESFSDTQARPEGTHPLLRAIGAIEMASGNGLHFSLTQGEVLARVEGEPVIALVEHGAGEVLVLADVGILGAAWGPPPNLVFWQNLAEYAR